MIFEENSDIQLLFPLSPPQIEAELESFGQEHREKGQVGRYCYHNLSKKWNLWDEILIENLCVME